MNQQSAILWQRLKTKLEQAVVRTFPEWRVFVRHANGSGSYFTVTRRHQLIVLGLAALGLLWAGIANIMLVQRPAEIAARAQQLDDEIDHMKQEQARLLAAGGLVNDLTREVSDVHTNLQVLADVRAKLDKDRADDSALLPLAKLQPESNGLTPAPEETSVLGTIRDKLRKLRTSLDQLKLTYSQAVEQTASIADQRTEQVSKSLAHLGVNMDKLLHQRSDNRGQGGPYIPLSGGQSRDMAFVLSSLDRWNETKAGMQTLPLAEPIHGEWEVNSPFGARFDPLNDSAGVHEGADLGGLPIGTPIYATGEGRVTLASSYDRYGLTVDVDHGNGFMTRYAHLSQIKVHVGQKVDRETIVGLLGNTGRTTGAHLHYEVRIDDDPRNPLPYIAAGRNATKTR